MLPRLMFLLCLAVSLTAAYAADMSPPIALTPEGRVLTNPMDNEEPDTLYYDDDTDQSFYFSQLTNYYVYVRFTPPAAFDLRSIYLALGYVGGAAPCSVWVHLPGTNNHPGTQLAATAIIPDANSWYDITLDDTVHFDANQDFMIVIGQSPGPNAWYPLVDGGSTVNRSRLTQGNRLTGTYQSITYDLRIRAGGSIATYVDLEAAQCFNDIGGNTPAWNMLPNTPVTLKSIVHNPTSNAISDYTVLWSVVGPNGGAPIFTNEAVGTTVNPGADHTVSATAPFTPTDLGEYFVTCLVNATNDANALNDTTFLRFFVGPQPRWFRYDDNQDPDGTVTFQQGTAKGISFKPVTYPARVESVRVAIGAGEQSDIEIYRNNAAGQPQGNSVWTNTSNLAAGWNNVRVNPPVLLTAGQSFTVAYMFGPTPVGLGKDANAPNCAEITNMGSVSWNFDGQSWTADNVGNWCIQAFIDTAAGNAADEPRVNLPSKFELSQNYPNPFNPTTDISFALPQESHVKLSVFNTLGQEVATLVNGTMGAGRHTITFQSSDLPAGVYLYRLDAGSDKTSYQAIRKMMLVK